MEDRLGIRDKEIIDERFGKLWSGEDLISIGDRIFTLVEIKRAFDLDTSDAVAIDLHAMPDGRFAFRFYDGDDRRIVVFVFDGSLDIVEEIRAHIAEWLGDEYHDTGMRAFDPEDMMKMLRAKVQGG
jgi:hypothetical protein